MFRDEVQLQDLDFQSRELVRREGREMRSAVYVKAEIWGGLCGSLALRLMFSKVVVPPPPRAALYVVSGSRSRASS
jgi:hypothetical protein